MIDIIIIDDILPECYTRCAMSIQEVLGTNTDSTRWSVIKALRACGGATVTELAEMVGVKPVTIRHHLISLQAEGLVDVTMKRHGVGRPSHFYRLTRKADRLFPHSYHVLVDRLLGEIKENFPPETVNMLIESLADSMASDVRREVADLPPEERRARLVEWMEAHGLTVRWRQSEDGLLQLVKYHCPYYAVGDDHPELCRIDEAMVSAVIDAAVKRSGCLLSGDPACALVLDEYAEDEDGPGVQDS